MQASTAPTQGSRDSSPLLAARPTGPAGSAIQYCQYSDAPGGPSTGQTAPSSTDTVIQYSIGGSATSGDDYAALSGTVTILAGDD